MYSQKKKHLPNTNIKCDFEESEIVDNTNPTIENYGDHINKSKKMKVPFDIAMTLAKNHGEELSVIPDENGRLELLIDAKHRDRIQPILEIVCLKFRCVCS